MTKKIALVVDDQEMFRDAVAFEMENLGFSVDHAADGEEGFKKSSANQYSIILSDIRMPNWDGVRFLKELRSIAPSSPPFLFMTGFADLTLQEAFEMGADDFLGKPINPDHLKSSIDRLLKSPLDQLATKVDAVDATLCIAPTQLNFGRRGAFIGGKINTRIAKVGSILSLELDTKEILPAIPEFKGVACVRWSRSIEDDEFHSGIGVEFLNLAEPHLSIFSKYLSANRLVATIPKGQRQDLPSNTSLRGKP